MPSREGRSLRPGNDTVYQPVNIHTSNPGVLQPGSARPNMGSGSVVNRGSVPGRSKNKFTNKDKGLNKRSY